jgi:gluconolactonase
MMKIREIASGLQFPEGPVAMDDGSVLLVEIARGTLTRVSPDGKLSVVAELGGGPNGAAMGPGGDIFVCNNGGFRWHRDKSGGLRPMTQPDDYSGGRIERVNLATGKVERIYERVASDDGEFTLRGPNDLVFDAQGGFWFTDLGKGRAREMDRGGIYYARADGGGVQQALYPVMTPNGIGLSPAGDVVYFAETESARLWAFETKGNGHLEKLPFPSPHGARFIAQPGGVYQRFDSLAVDSIGNVLVATLLHGGITTIAPDGRLLGHLPLPDPYVTNLCFGGPDLRTLYVTLSNHGRLIAIDGWPVPGLRLNHQ